MNEQILNAIDNEIARLRQARAILVERGIAPSARKSAAAAPGSKPRTLSLEARKAIANAQRKRWAKVKRQKKAAVSAAAPARKAAAAG